MKKSDKTMSLEEYMDTSDGELCIKISKKNGSLIKSTIVISMNGKQIGRLQEVILRAHANSSSYLAMAGTSVDKSKATATKIDFTQTIL